LQGYYVEHRNGGDTTDGPVWTFTFPSFVVPDDGVLAAGDMPLGFAVVAQQYNSQVYVANADFILPGGLLNSGDGLILYDAQGNILDAVVWLGATYRHRRGRSRARSRGRVRPAARTICTRSAPIRARTPVRRRPTTC
jgi:hypothetical protein